MEDIGQSTTARIYLDPNDLPSHPGNEWTRFVCISDSHSRIFPVPPGDVLLHAGDLSSWGYPKQLDVTMQWLKSLSHPMKIIVAGNHDLCLDPHCDLDLKEIWKDATEAEKAATRLTLVRSQDLQNAGIHYLEYEALCFTTSTGKQWKVYGSPATPYHVGGAFQYSTAAEADEIYRQVPSDTEILITHTPPRGVLDKTERRAVHAGCPTLADKMGELDKCRLHVFGHIHEAYGAKAITVNPCVSIVAVNAALPRSGQAIVVDLRN